MTVVRPYLIVLLGCLLVACGGSGSNKESSNTAAAINDTDAIVEATPSPWISRRAVNLIFDFDNDGDSDMVITNRFDSEGRVENVDTEFEDIAFDSVPTYELYKQREMVQYMLNINLNYLYTTHTQIKYDELGRVSSHLTDYDDIYNPEPYGYDYENAYSWDKYTYNYADSNHLKSVTYNTGGYRTIFGDVLYQFDYLAEQLVRWSSSFITGGYSFPDPNLFFINEINYNQQGLVSSLWEDNRPLQRELIIEYAWQADNKIERIFYDDPLYEDKSFARNYFYDASGRLEKIIDFGGRNYLIGTLHFRYDQNDNLKIIDVDIDSDGSVEGTMQVKWEEGVCKQSYLWLPSLSINFVKTDDIPYAPGSGYLSLAHCSGETWIL